MQRLDDCVHCIGQITATCKWKVATKALFVGDCGEQALIAKLTLVATPILHKPIIMILIFSLEIPKHI